MPFEAELRDASAYLHDRRSQLLALEDALQSRNTPALVRVFAAVALAQGLERIALQTETDRSALFAALKDPASPDPQLLAYVIARLAAADGGSDEADARREPL